MTPSGKTADLIVVGGGVVGLSVARDAADRGLAVTVLDRGAPGREASWAAAGMLSPLGEAGGTDPFLDLGLAGLRMYPSWARELEEETGVDLEYREAGKLRVALSDEGVSALEERLGWAREMGIEARWVDGKEIRELEPAVTPEVDAGLLVEEDHALESRSLGDALAAAAEARGVEIREGREVRGVEISDGRVRGVVMDDGTRVPAGAVLVAAGAWSGALEGLPGPLPVHPVRGQMVALRPDSIPSRRVVESEKGYLVPRPDGRVLVGSTEEEVGFRTGTTAEGIRDLLRHAVELMPTLGSAPVAELWSGLRPGTPDRNPILGPDPDAAGLFYATGHFRNGILLAPVTGRLLVLHLAGEEGEEIPPAFLPGRFRQR